jgi:hypothetical protein
VAVPYAVRMIAVFVVAAEQHGRAVAGDRPAAMMLAQVEQSDRIGDGFRGQIDGLRRCRLCTQNKSLLNVKIRCVARKSMGDRAIPTGFTWRAMRRNAVKVRDDETGRIVVWPRRAGTLDPSHFCCANRVNIDACETREGAASVSSFYSRGHSSSTRVRCRIASLICGRCLMLEFGLALIAMPCCGESRNRRHGLGLLELPVPAPCR